MTINRKKSAGAEGKCYSRGYFFKCKVLLSELCFFDRLEILPTLYPPFIFGDAHALKSYISTRNSVVTVQD
jgi:hypothetical protein